ncbi:MAG: hypothetical protein DI537_23915 [Stutzerimonas stutzeri]|nr:MAG: hypothetical protein DI537_23915 [Stutzerimonas stutzeri]
MKTRILHVVAESKPVAISLAKAIAKGQLPTCGHYETEDLAQAWAEHCNGLLGARLVSVWPIAVEVRTVDDGRIINAWTVDQIGERAAAFVLTFLLPVLAAHFWGFIA